MRLQARSRRSRKRIGALKQASRWIRYTVLTRAALLLCLALVMLINYILQGKAARETQKSLQDELRQTGYAAVIIQSIEPVQTPVVQATVQGASVPPALRPMPTAGAAMLPRFVSLFSKNRDMVGWLSSDAVYDIDFPIVKRDNTFYLDRDFYGRKNLAGTVFMDEGNTILPQDQNIILHGHNMKNGSMFGKLTRLMDKGFLVKAPFFSFSTLYMEETFVPFAVSLVSIDPGSANYFDFSRLRFNNEQALAGYVQRLKATSVMPLPVDVTSGDLLLTLVTCHGNEASERLIIGLRALRPMETRESVLKQLME